ncbi:hypothetical protein GQ457_03G015890 [Hibiscus cannabinus]
MVLDGTGMANGSWFRDWDAGESSVRDNGSNEGFDDGKGEGARRDGEVSIVRWCTEIVVASMSWKCHKNAADAVDSGHPRGVGTMHVRSSKRASIWVWV